MSDQTERAQLLSRWLFAIATNAGKELSAANMTTISTAVFDGVDAGLLPDIEGVLAIIAQADNRPPPCSSCCQQHTYLD